MRDLELTVRLPDGDGRIRQDEEWCWVSTGDGGARRIRFHDYHAVFAVPGLYERLFGDLLHCVSPEVVASMLAAAVRADGGDPADLRVLDLGAGNGLVGEALVDHGAGSVVGVDIAPEAGAAVERDRPDVYDAYHVCDLLAPAPDVAAALRAARFTALTSVGALSFGDIPTRVFLTALDLVEDGGWVAFNLHEDVVAEPGSEGFGALVAEMIRTGALDVRDQRRYRHRLAVSGEPIHYVAFVARKRRATRRGR